MSLQKEKNWLLETLLYSFGIYIFCHFRSLSFLEFCILTICYPRGENGESRVGISRAAHQERNIPTSSISKQSMHHGVVATALNTIKNKCMFVVFYKPR